MDLIMDIFCWIGGAFCILMIIGAFINDILNLFNDDFLDDREY